MELSQRRPLCKPLDALDAFQLAKALYTASLLLAWFLNLRDNSTQHVIEMLGEAGDVNGGVWIGFLMAYTIASASCLFWKNDKFQTGVSFVSVWLWMFNGVTTLLSSPQGPASGIFQLTLGAVSVLALYFRGRLSSV